MSEGPKLENLNLKTAPMGEPIPMIGNLPKTYGGGHWRPIETAPKDGSWILLIGGVDAHGWDHEEPMPPMVVAQWAQYGECWQFAWYDSGYYGEYDKPTHWTHLPEMPDA